MTGHEVHVPAEVAKSVATRWPDLYTEWHKCVVNELAELCARYEAVPVATFGARYGLVVEVATKAGRLVMRSSPDPHGAEQARVSVAMSKLGKAPKVRECFTSDTGTWVIMDRIVPGTTLDKRPIPLSSLASLLQPMLNQPSPDNDMPSLVDWLRQRLLDDELSDLAPGRQPAPRKQRQSAMSDLARLATRPMDGLCHGDASPRNILEGQRSALFLIDPRGVRGEVAYDVAIAAWKTAGDGRAEPRAMQLAQLVGIAPDRVAAWLSVADAARV